MKSPERIGEIWSTFRDLIGDHGRNKFNTGSLYMTEDCSQPTLNVITGLYISKGPKRTFMYVDTSIRSIQANDNDMLITKNSAYCLN